MNTYKFEVYIPKDCFDDTVKANTYDEAVNKLKKKWGWAKNHLKFKRVDNNQRKKQHETN